MTEARSTDAPTAAPRLLLGATVLLWGGISGRPLIGLIAAVAVEAAHWTTVRWDFGESAFLRAWQTSILLLLLAIGLVWLDASAISALPKTMTWLPVLMLPLQFVQSYGMRRSMSLSSISLFLRKRKKHAARHGLPFRDVRFCFDHVFFGGTVIAAALGEHARSPIFFPAVVLLTGWLMLPRLVKTLGSVPLAGGLVLVLATVGGFGGEKVLDWAYQRFVFGLDGTGHYRDYSRQTRTMIGKLEEIKQSPGIQWRLIPRQGELPRLLRVAAYNSYRNTSWWAEQPKRTDGQDVEDFETVESFGIDPEYWVTAREATPEDATHAALPRFTLRGGTPRKDLFPIPGNAASMVLPTYDLDINAFGSLRLDPRHPVADALILWGDPMTTAMPPGPAARRPDGPMPELMIPEDEREAIARVVDELGLRGQSLSEIVTTLRAWYATEFTYTRYLEKPHPESEFERESFISIFLTASKRGHCEYFATATAFLLRECGIPTRYATGFAVAERDPKTGDALIRGIHGHAWCLAWDAERSKWIDVDLTPPDWTGRETPRMPAWQGLLDRWQIMRDNILVWRSQPGNLAIALGLIFLPLAAGALLIGRRLWRSKRRIGRRRSRRDFKDALARSPLAALERPAEKVLGERPPGAPLGRWLLGLRTRLDESDELERAVEMHQHLRFDPDHEPDLRERLEGLVKPLRARISRLV